jgi:hypothetical protein
MKTKNLAHLAIPAEQLAAILSAMTSIEVNTSNLTALSPDEKQRSRGIGPRSELFCRRALALMQRHAQLVPSKVPLAQTVAELQAFDDLRIVLDRLTELLAKVRDSHFILGSNLYAVALVGYNQLRLLGDSDGLKEACAELGQLFARNGIRAKGRQVPSAPTTPPPDTGSAT